MLNLSTAATRGALRKMVDLPGSGRLAYFTSRSLEGGRERFRLHLGYFGSLAEAQSWLPALREAYPAAWAGQVPVAANLDAPEVPGAVPTVQAVPSVRALPVPELPARGAIPVARPAGRDVIPSLAPAPRPPVLGAYSPGPRTVPGTPPTVSQTSSSLRVVENRSAAARKSSPPRTSSTSSKLPVVRPNPPAPASPAPPFYAVQLARAPLPMEIEDVPPIPLLDEYTVYTVEGMREGTRWYAVRVGFFKELPDATAVAVKLRSEFAGIAVVGVSQDEKRAATGEDGGSVDRVAAVPAPQTFPGATRWTPSVAEVNFGDALGSADDEDNLDRMGGASGEYAAGFLQQLGARKRRLLRGRPFLRLLERLGGRIKDL